MRILYITTIGGTMDFFKKLIKTLIDSGNIVDIATNEKTSKVSHCFRYWGCKVFNISTSRSLFSFGNIKAIKQIKNIAKNYDIVHCHTPLAGIATRIACRGLRKKQNLKVVYTAHGFHFYKGAPFFNWLLYYPIEVICSKWTDVLLTINHEDYNLAKQKMKSRSIVYIPGVGIDNLFFSTITADREKIINELKIPSESKLVISVGELNKNKNHEVIIKALSLVNESNIHYIIAGIGKMDKRLLKIAKKNNVNLHLLGFRADIGVLCKSCDVFIFPSIREGLGIAALEGMACGLPLICSINRGTREYMSFGSIGCDCDDVKSFSMAIKKVLDNAQMRKEMSSKNIEIAKKFDVNIVIEKMLIVYNKLKMVE